jgi:hypothetical protein
MDVTTLTETNELLYCIQHITTNWHRQDVDASEDIQIVCEELQGT